MEELFKQLSPEERQRKKLELELLGQKSRQVQLENEYREMMIPKMRNYQSAIQGVESRKRSILGGGNLTGQDTHAAIQPKPLEGNYPDTHPAEMSMGDLMPSLGLSAVASAVPTPLLQAPDPEEAQPGEDSTNELPPLTDLPPPLP